MLELSADKKKEKAFFLRMLAKIFWAASIVIILASCGTSPGYNYTISGAISGMIGSGLVLQNNGGDDLTITSNGAFSFNKAIDDKAIYSVTVKPGSQPINPEQNCVVSNGSGSINGAPVSNVVVSCTMSSHPVAVDTSGSFVYMTKSATFDVLAGNIDTATGGLNKLSSSPYKTETDTNPTHVTIYPDPALWETVTAPGQFLYVSNFADDGEIFVYTITGSDGALTPRATAPAGKCPTAVAVDPTGQFAYVANMTSDNISAYTVNPTTGALTAIAGSPFAAGTSPTGVAIDKSGNFVYAVNMTSGTVSAYKITPATGVLTAVVGSPFAAGTYPTALTILKIDDSTQYVYVSNLGTSNISAYKIDPATGALNDVSGSPFNTTGTFPNPVTVTKIVNGSTTTYAAYVSNMGNSLISVYTINATTGALSPVATGVFDTGIYPNPVTIAKIDDATQYAYVSNMGDGTISAYKIESDGRLTALTGTIIGETTLPNTVTIGRIISSPNYFVAYVSQGSDSTIRAYKINANGSLSEVSGSPYTLF